MLEEYKEKIKNKRKRRRRKERKKNKIRGIPADAKTSSRHENILELSVIIVRQSAMTTYSRRL